jgi:uncharacterized protein (TIGR02246 family)
MIRDQHDNRREAIERILKQRELSWNASDSATIGELFAEDATLIQIYGGQLDGRAAIQASHRHIFDTIYKGSHATFTLRSIRFLNLGLAIVFTRAHVDLYEGAQPRQIDTRPAMIVVKQQNKWQIVTFQNTRISEMPAAARAASLLAT